MSDREYQEARHRFEVEPVPAPSGRPAHGYPAYIYPYASGTPYGPPDPTSASIASAVTFLAGLWLIISPFVLDYRGVSMGFNGYWNDITIGTAIALLVLIRVVAPGNRRWLSLVTAALGGWLMLAPFLLGYNEGTDATAATANDMIVGGIVVIAAAFNTVTPSRSNRTHDAEHTD